MHARLTWRRLRNRHLAVPDQLRDPGDDVVGELRGNAFWEHPAPVAAIVGEARLIAQTHRHPPQIVRGSLQPAKDGEGESD